MSDTHHGHGDDDRRDETTGPDESAGTRHGHRDADDMDVVGTTPAQETEQFAGASDHTDRYTAPYPTADAGSADAAPTAEYGQYGQYAQQGQYGQGGQYGSGRYGSDQYGSGQYGSGQSGTAQYGQDQYGTAQYGQGQYGTAQYGQGQYGEHDTSGDTRYGQQDQYGQGQYGQGQYGQQGTYGQDAPRYGEHASDHHTASGASAFGAAADQRPENGHYFTGAPAATSTTPRDRSGRNRLVLPLVAAAVIAGLVGGGAGWAAGAASDGGTVVGGSGTSQSGGNLTVNDYDSATVVTAVAAKATPSVVTINVSASSEAGTGSGVVLNKEGYIVTNTHVVTLDGDSANGTISVTTSNGKVYKGTLVGTDPTVDLAVIKIDAPDLTPIDFADSSKLNVGDTAVAIGAPLGLSNTVTDGIVSTLNRSIQVTSSDPNAGGDTNEGQGNNGNGPFDFWGNGDNGSSSGASTTVSLPVIQTDASINPGNSGGALLDDKGALIGINVAIASAGSSDSSSSQAGSIGVGFSIPSNLVKRVATEIVENGKATHGLLGASVGDATEDASATQVGALIKDVTSGGAAADAGLQKGDVVTKLGDASIADATDLTAQVRFYAGGATTEITYVRNGETRTANVKLGTYDSSN
ncbi:trypsin-like peptidase domain-containing protein [Curtobacterium sp. MCPF17_050]|uniref:S1C family serine protease n=1 Tax=Curtobacterium sp. MCPF17_050 TaxID=2175664 RepID=UPI0021ACEAAD|nr:trypsin-like peptidase domain-containing protein [Curtobacterium sp. MCPF17_050]WIB16367.1 trypsin-like peptidase domain-containing protein [Curtobacterium sp. MCPF17_050]